MLDFEYAKALAEVVLDTTCSEKEREVRLECSTQIFGRANAYLKKGFLPDVVEAFFCAKNERFATGIDKAGYAGFFESQYTPLFWREIYS